MRMKTIKYDPTLSSDPYQSHEYAIMEEDLHGEYVKYEDYQLLEAKIAELEEWVQWGIDNSHECENKDLAYECLHGETQ